MLALASQSRNEQSRLHIRSSVPHQTQSDDRVPFEKRGVFVERVVARLQQHRGFTDADLDEAVRVALTGLILSAA